MKENPLSVRTFPVEALSSVVYLLHSADGELLYVGVSDKPASRLEAHRLTAPWWNEVATATWEDWSVRHLAEQRERELIRSAHPVYNVMDACTGCEVCKPR